jgi:hypothetical protein
VGQIVREDIASKIGASTTTIQVTTEPAPLSTDSATIGTVVSNEQLTHLPLNGPGFYQLAETTPGAVLLVATGNSLAIRPEIVNGNTISGGRSSTATEKTGAGERESEAARFGNMPAQTRAAGHHCIGGL